MDNPGVEPDVCHPQHVHLFAGASGASKRTIDSDIAALHSGLKTRGMDVARRRGSVLLKGDEAAFRALMSEFLEWVGSGFEQFAQPGKNQNVSGSRSILQPVLNQIEHQEAAEKVSAILTVARQKFKLDPTMNTMGALAAHILVSLTQVKQGSFVQVRAEQIQRLKRRLERPMVSWLAGAIGEVFSVVLPEAELVSTAPYLRRSL